MAGELQNRVAIVTGAGTGLGRSHAMFLAAHGAQVVVNDLGVEVDGRGSGSPSADRVVNEIRAGGGIAIPSAHDVSDWAQAAALIELATETFGRLDVLVNNAGILRDRTIANMSEAEWDDVIRVHLKGHLAPTRHAVAYWRDAAKRGDSVQASVISTTSVGAFAPAYGQANYTAAKLAIIGLTLTVSLEAGKYGVRSNAVSPSARTRMSMGSPEAESRLRPPGSPEVFDNYAPENVSPLVGWLATASCPADRQIFHLGGRRLVVAAMPEPAHVLESSDRWSIAQLDRDVTPRLVSHPTEQVWFGN